MTSRDDEPLDSAQQDLIDQLCRQFDQNPNAGLTEIADLIAQAPDKLQTFAAEAILERHFARQLANDQTIDERDAAKQLGLGEDLVRMAKKAAMAANSLLKKMHGTTLGATAGSSSGVFSAFFALLGKPAVALVRFSTGC